MVYVRAGGRGSTIRNQEGTASTWCGGSQVSPVHPVRRESRLTWLGREVPEQPFAGPAWGAEIDGGPACAGRKCPAEQMT